MLRLTRIQSLKAITSRCASASAQRYPIEEHIPTDRYYDWNIDRLLSEHYHARLGQAFHKNPAEFNEYVTRLFGYDKVMPMNTSVEACQTAVKLAHRWAYEIKGVKANKSKIVFASENRIEASVSNSDFIPFNDVKALEKTLSSPNVAAFMFEPIQGVVVPSNGYLRRVRELCTNYNVLMIANEVQTGLGRTGRMLCCDHEEVRPDIVTLGKSLSSGIYPISIVLADNSIMQESEAGQYYYGNSMAFKFAIEVLEIIKNERLCENAEEMGTIFRRELKRLPRKTVTNVTGKGLLNAIVINPKVDAWKVCLKLKENGILAKYIQSDIIRLSPSLTIKENQIREISQIIIETFYKFENW